MYNVWGGTCNCYLKNLIVQHKHFIRAMSDANYLDNTAPLFSRLNLLNFTDIYRYHVAIFMFKNSNNFSLDHGLNTRQHNLANPNYSRLSGPRNSIMYKGPEIWNELPQHLKDLKNLTSLSVFKRRLKAHFIDKY